MAQNAMWKHSHAKQKLATFYGEHAPLKATDIYIEAMLQKYSPRQIENRLLKKYGVTTNLVAGPSEPIITPVPIPIKPIYAFFSDSVLEKVQGKNPAADHDDISALIGSEWGRRTTAERKRIEAKAEADKMRYAGEMQIWLAEGQRRKKIPAPSLSLSQSLKNGLQYYENRRLQRQSRSQSIPQALQGPFMTQPHGSAGEGSFGFDDGSFGFGESSFGESAAWRGGVVRPSSAIPSTYRTPMH
jgi:hypothetical protein